MKPFYFKNFNPIEYPLIFLIPPSIWTGIYKKDFLFKNNIKFLTTPGASYQDTSFFFKTLFKSKNIFFCGKAFLNYRQTNLNSSVYNNTLSKAMFVHKEYFEIEKYLKTDLNSFYKIEKVYNSKKLMTLLWNLEKVDKKKEYIKIINQSVFKILKNKNYLPNHFSEKEKKFFNYLINYGEEITSEIYINSLNYNKSNPKISLIIPFNNCEKFIEECLNNLINQSFKNFEIIFINENSTDKTLEKIKEFQKKDERIFIYSKIKNIEISRNTGIKNSKGEYLMFLDCNDIFDKSMLEEIFINIKVKQDEILICNSNQIELKKKKKNIIKFKNISDNLLNKSFSILNISKNFFDIFVFWPLDKIYKKEFLVNLIRKFPNLKYSEDLNFIVSAIFEANKISFLEKSLINHRVGINSLSNLNEKNLEKFYFSLKELKIFLKNKDLYKKFKQDFINYVASYSIYQIENIGGKSFCFLYKNLRNKWWNELGISKYSKNYFYDKNIYKKVKNILELDIELKETVKEFKNNNKKIKYLKEQKIYCIKRISANTEFNNINIYVTFFIKKVINKILIIYFIFINLFILYIKII
jgi:glycosyltransferase involved in cell wall biosynthesis